MYFWIVDRRNGERISQIQNPEKPKSKSRKIEVHIRKNQKTKSKDPLKNQVQQRPEKPKSNDPKNQVQSPKIRKKPKSNSVEQNPLKICTYWCRMLIKASTKSWKILELKLQDFSFYEGIEMSSPKISLSPLIK